MVSRKIRGTVEAGGRTTRRNVVEGLLWVSCLGLLSTLPAGCNTVIGVEDVQIRKKKKKTTTEEEETQDAPEDEESDAGTRSR